MTRRSQRVIASHAFAAVGMSMPWPTLLVTIDAATQSALILGLAAGARLAPYVLFSWLSGRLADRRERAHIVRLSLVARVGTLAGCAIALAGGHWQVALAAATLAVVAGTPAYPAIAAGLPQLDGDAAGGVDHAERATRLLVTVEVSSFVVGPALGGLLVDRAPTWCAAALGAGLVVVAMASFAGTVMPAPSRESSASVVAVAVAPPTVLRVLRGNPAAMQALWTVVALNVVVSATSLLILTLTDEHWGTGPSGFGLLTAALGAGGLLAPVLPAVSRRVTLAGSLGTAALSAAAIAGMPVSGPWSTALAVPVLVGLGAVSVMGEAKATSVVQHTVPEDRKASVLGLADSAMIGAAMLASFVTPALAATIGAVAGTAALAVFGLLATWVARQLTRDRSRALRRGHPAHERSRTDRIALDLDVGAGEIALPGHGWLPRLGASVVLGEIDRARYGSELGCGEIVREDHPLGIGPRAGRTARQGLMRSG